MAEKNFLLVGGNFINKGAEAMLKSVQQYLILNYPEAKIYVICNYIEKDEAIREGFIPVYRNLGGVRMELYKFYRRVRAGLAKKLGFKPHPYTDVTPLSHMRRTIKKLDLGIDVSGYAYHDDRDYLQPLETIKAIRFCRKKGAKYIFMPQAWGSFEKPKVAANIRKMIGLCNGYYVRDTVSKNHISELLKLSPGKIPVYPDIAFSFSTPSLDVGRQLLVQAGRSVNQRKLLAIAPNMRVYDRSDGNRATNTYVKKLKGLIEYTIHKLDMDVVLVPNEIFPTTDYIWDDRFICRLLMKEIERPDRCFFISEYHSATEIKSVIGNTDLLVGSRFHSLIFGLSQGVPCLAISWSHKYRELFRLFDMEKFVVEDSELKNDPTIDLLNELVRDREKWSAHIEGVLPEIRKKLQTPFKHLSEEV